MIDIFVSVPYNHPRQDMIDFRLEMLDQYLMELINKDFTPYSTVQAMLPLAAKFDLSTDYDYWKRHCSRMIAASDALHVLMLPGWRDSVGVRDEIETALLIGIPVSYIDSYYHR
jgi:hypothetical protein